MYEPRIAVLVPCYNEGDTIGRVVADFRAALPTATVYVYDNNSRDETIARARAAGAVVRSETLQGKGNVVRRMFGDIEADIYVMVDGDATYDAFAAPELVDRLITGCLDMVVGRRVHHEEAAYRSGHRFGNQLFTGAVATLFGKRFSDILSGYRVFSRRFVKSFPALTTGFDIETELTVHALTLNLPIDEIATNYYSRPEGSFSKLNTYADGWRILKTIIRLVRRERPMAFYSWLSAVLALTAIVLAIPLAHTYILTGLVPRLPTAVLAASIMLVAALSLVCGFILDTVTTGRREVKRLSYLNVPQHDWVDIRPMVAARSEVSSTTRLSRP
jgi:glycosyltransferase involved in cell wall biosynthesis